MVILGVLKNDFNKSNRMKLKYPYLLLCLVFSMILLYITMSER